MPDHPEVLLPSEPSVRQGLPRPRTQLFGRAQEISQITDLLAGGRLVTITGEGGIGETRVATEVALRQPRRVLFVSLADVDRSGVAGAIFRAAVGGAPPFLSAPLIHGEQSVVAIWAGLAEELAGAPLLLILDTFEHVTDSVGLLNEIRSTIPDLAILVTSRCRLGLSDESVVPLLGLPVEPGGPAAGMFAERSRRVGADQRPDDEEQQSAVLEICRLLGGVPLAIELAASRTALMTPMALLAQFRLTDRGRVLGLLSRGSVDLPSRQLNMRATLSWSYQLLDGAQQTFFRRLAIFPGSFTLDAVERVCSAALTSDGRPAPDALLNGIAELVDLHLVEPLAVTGAKLAVEARFELHDAPRAFAVELLEMSGESEPIGARLREWCLDFAARAEIGIASTDEQRWLDRIESELPSLRYTLAFFAGSGDAGNGVALATGIAGFWAVRGPLAEAAKWLRTFLEIDRAGGGLTQQLRAIAVAWANRLGLQTDGLVNIGDARNARATVVGEPCSPALWLRSTDHLVYGLIALGEITESLAIIEEGLRLARATRDSYWTSLYLYRRACVEWMTMEMEPTSGALAFAEEALAVATDHGHHRLAAQSQALVGFCRLAERDVAGARESMLLALRSLQDSGGHTSAIDAMNTLGVISAQLAEPLQAAQFLREAMLQARLVGYGHGEIFSAWATAYLCCTTGRVPDAVAMDHALTDYLSIIDSWLPRDIFRDYQTAIRAARRPIESARTLGRGWGWLRARAMQIASELAGSSTTAAAPTPTWSVAASVPAAVPAMQVVPAVAGPEASSAGGSTSAGSTVARAGAAARSGPGAVQGKPDRVGLAPAGGDEPGLPADGRLRTAHPAYRPELTARELEILAAIASGRTNPQIARDLFLSAKTVMHHSTSIYRKLAVGGRAEAVALAYRTGLLSTPTA